MSHGECIKMLRQNKSHGWQCEVIKWQRAQIPKCQQLKSKHGRRLKNATLDARGCTFLVKRDLTDVIMKTCVQPNDIVDCKKRCLVLPGMNKENFSASSAAAWAPKCENEK